MNGVVVIEKAKILNVVEKQSDDGKIVWYEVVFMQNSDVNTVTINKNTADKLEIDQIYDLLMQITEVLKGTKSGQAFKSHKLRVIDCYDLED